MSAETFSFRPGDRLIRFGAGVLAQAPQLIAGEGLGGYTLLTTARARAYVPDALLTDAQATLDVEPGAVPQLAAAALDRVVKGPLVAFGGGRVVDVTKAVAAVRGVRCAAIPTTLAGSTFTPFHRAAAGHETAPQTAVALAICDPHVMTSVPMPGLAATAMNALAHAVEALYAPGANPVAEGAALQAIAGFGRALKRDSPDGVELARAATLAGWAVGTTGLALHHAVCQTIVRRVKTPHAQTNAVMLAHSVAAMVGRAPRELALVAEALGAEGSRAAGPAIARLAARSGAQNLTDLGVGPDRLDELVQACAQHPGLANTPGGEVTDVELRALLQSALAA